jgi:hypothetical protein
VQRLAALIRSVLIIKKDKNVMIKNSLKRCAGLLLTLMALQAQAGIVTLYGTIVGMDVNKSGSGITSLTLQALQQTACPSGVTDQALIGLQVGTSFTSEELKRVVMMASTAAALGKQVTVTVDDTACDDAASLEMYF